MTMFVRTLATLIMVTSAATIRADDSSPTPPSPKPLTLDHPARILVLGDSNTHNGHFTGVLASLLEQRHGYFGSGYRSIVADVGNGQDDAYQPYLRITNHGEWKSVHFIGGVAAAVLSPDGTCLESDNPEHTAEVRFFGSAIDIFYAAHGKGGAFTAQLDGEAARQVETASDTLAIRRERIDGLTPQWHTLTLRPVGGAAVTLTGVEAHAAPPGDKSAVVHKWGRSYAATTHYAGLEPAVWGSALSLVKPDWIVVMLGTNDHMNFIVSAPIMLNNLGTICERLREGAPEARLMIVSTVPVGQGATYSNRLRQRYREALPSLARALGADYWDLAAACGETNEAWFARGETGDRIHFNQKGAAVAAPQLLEAIDRAAASPAPEPETFVERGTSSEDDRPADLGSLWMWFAADGPIVLDEAGRVVRWDNAVKLSYLPIPRQVQHARSLVPGMRPRWVENAVHGKPAVRFDGATTSLALPFDSNAAGFAMVLKVNKTGGALFGSSLALYKRYGPPPEGSNLLINPDTELKGTFHLNGRALPKDGVAVPLGQYVVLSYEGGGAFAIIGANEHYQRYTSGPGDPETLSFFDGEIAELVTWGALAPKHEGQRGRLESYLAAKYGIVLSSEAR